MADPLSIAASILAILGASSANVQAYRSLCAAPDELTRLDTELEHLSNVIRDIKELPTDGLHSSRGLTNGKLDAEAKVKEVRDFMQARLSPAKPPSASV